MSLTTTLTTALTGLTVSQQAMQVLAGNISNANTPDYSRQVTQQSATVIDGSISGVKLENIVRKVDLFLNSALQKQNSVFSKADTLNTFMQYIQNQLGQPGASVTLDTSITSFFNSLQTLAATPTQGSLQLGAVNAGANLALQLSQLATNLQNLRLQADQQLKTEVANDNSTLTQLAQVNSAINNAYFSGKSTASLLDQRDALLNTLGKSLDVTYYFAQSGQVNVSTNGGIPLITGGERYELDYTPLSSVQAFTQGSPVGPINVYRLDSHGNRVGDPTALATGGTGSQISTSMVNGNIRALMDVRDQMIPNVLSQLDELASQLRDAVNAVQNSGSGFPGASTYTGQRAVSGFDSSLWSGNVRIGLVDKNGQPIASPYSDETYGFAPMNLHLGTLDSGYGSGKPTVQTIVDQINQYFTPRNKVELGDLNNIQIVSDSNTVSSTSPSFTFDFNLENLKSKSADFFVTNVQVLDDTNTDISSTSSTIPSVALSAANTYVTSAGSGVVTINTASSTALLHEGDTVYLSTPPGGPYDGIPAAQLGGYFTISNVSGSSFQITVGTPAAAGGTFGVAGQTVMPAYSTANPLDTTRTVSNGTITADLTANPSSAFYTINVNVGVKNADGTISVGQIQYQLPNGNTNFLNQRLTALAASGSATLVQPSSQTPLVTAKLVDADGNEIPKLNGQYLNIPGYLKITSADPNVSIAIDSLDSKQLGVQNSNGTTTGTNRSFAYYFGLNNFFNSNTSTDTGEALANSAINMAVTSAVRNNPGLLSLGVLTRSPQPADPNAAVNPTYTLNPGDSSTAERMSAISGQSFTFDPAGGLGTTITSLNGYAGDLLGNLATTAQNIQNDRNNQNTILTGFQSQASSISGVNLDEELANTIIYQNAYAASAKIITVTSQLFSTLLGAFQGA